MKQREAELKSAVLKTIRLLYPKVISIQIYNGGIPDGKGGFRPPPTLGVPDIIGFFPTYSGLCMPFAFEIKSEKGKLTEYQTEFFKRFSESGYYTAIIKSVDDVKWHMDSISSMTQSLGIS